METSDAAEMVHRLNDLFARRLSPNSLASGEEIVGI